MWFMFPIFHDLNWKGVGLCYFTFDYSRHPYSHIYIVQNNTTSLTLDNVEY